MNSLPTTAVSKTKHKPEFHQNQLPVMLRLGYAAMQVEDWEAAAKAYRKYCVYESDVSRNSINSMEILCTGLGKVPRIGN